MSQTHGLLLEGGYHSSVAAPQPVVERGVPLWTVIFVVLAAIAAFAPSVAVTWAAGLREPAATVCTDDGFAASAANRRAVTEAMVSGHEVPPGRC